MIANNPAMKREGSIHTTMSSENGGSSGLESSQNVPPPEVHLLLPFRSRPAYRDNEFLHQKYTLEGLSVAQIASEIGSSKEAVRKGLFRAGIKPRAPCENYGHPSQPGFGNRIVKGRAVPHLGELRTSKLIHHYYSDGLSLRRIAAMLNQKKIPTKTNLGTWHPEMVSRVLTP